MGIIKKVEIWGTISWRKNSEKINRKAKATEKYCSPLKRRNEFVNQKTKPENVQEWGKDISAWFQKLLSRENSANVLQNGQDR